MTERMYEWDRVCRAAPGKASGSAYKYEEEDIMTYEVFLELNTTWRILLCEVTWLEVLLGTVPVFLSPCLPFRLAHPATPVKSDSQPGLTCSSLWRCARRPSCTPHNRQPWFVRRACSDGWNLTHYVTSPMSCDMTWRALCRVTWHFKCHIIPDMARQLKHEVTCRMNCDVTCHRSFDVTWCATWLVIWSESPLDIWPEMTHSVTCDITGRATWPYVLRHKKQGITWPAPWNVTWCDASYDTWHDLMLHMKRDEAWTA